MTGWARVMGGRLLHYYERTAYVGRSTAVCGARGVANVLPEDNDLDKWVYPKCKKCLSKLEGK